VLTSVVCIAPVSIAQYFAILVARLNVVGINRSEEAL